MVWKKSGKNNNFSRSGKSQICLMASLTRVFFLCQETHQRPFGVANSSYIAFEVPLASELFVAIWPYIS